MFGNLIATFWLIVILLLKCKILFSHHSLIPSFSPLGAWWDDVKVSIRRACVDFSVQKCKRLNRNHDLLTSSDGDSVDSSSFKSKLPVRKKKESAKLRLPLRLLPLPRPYGLQVLFPVCLGALSLLQQSGLALLSVCTSSLFSPPHGCYACSSYFKC